MSTVYLIGSQLIELSGEAKPDIQSVLLRFVSWLPRLASRAFQIRLGRRGKQNLAASWRFHGLLNPSLLAEFANMLRLESCYVALPKK